MKTFSLIFKSLSNLNSDTMLLEACQWDEARADELFKRAFALAFQLSADTSVRSWKDFKALIRQGLCVTFNDIEIDAMMQVIDKVAETGALETGEAYEN